MIKCKRIFYCRGKKTHFCTSSIGKYILNAKDFLTEKGLSNTRFLLSREWQKRGSGMTGKREGAGSAILDNVAPLILRKFIDFYRLNDVVPLIRTSYRNSIKSWKTTGFSNTDIFGIYIWVYAIIFKFKTKIDRSVWYTIICDRKKCISAASSEALYIITFKLDFGWGWGWGKLKKIISCCITSLQRCPSHSYLYRELVAEVEGREIVGERSWLGRWIIYEDSTSTIWESEEWWSCLVENSVFIEFFYFTITSIIYECISASTPCRNTVCTDYTSGPLSSESVTWFV